MSLIRSVGIEKLLLWNANPLHHMKTKRNLNSCTGHNHRQMISASFSGLWECPPLNAVLSGFFFSKHLFSFHDHCFNSYAYYTPCTSALQGRILLYSKDCIFCGYHYISSGTARLLFFLHKPAVCMYKNIKESVVACNGDHTFWSRFVNGTDIQ